MTSASAVPSMVSLPNPPTIVGTCPSQSTGSTTVVQVGDRPWSLIGRLRPGIDPGSCLSRFYTLNGGEHRVLQPGDLVFLDDAEPQAR